VIESSIGATVDTVPEGAEPETLGGTDYRVYGSTYYLPSYGRSIVLQQMVAGFTA